ncbi:MAG TPA: phosphoesterase, partial [Epsilonproteobacteria bacterium]|nr:phosphoesterase [Campylobacterota bacterium]
MYQHIYHLSHIDLDGYGCQYLTTHCFETISCFNANYGPEVTARLEEIIQEIETTPACDGKRQELLILITDLNLTTREAGWIEREAIRLGVKLQLLDHHGTGKTAAEKYAWYTLDTKRCATLITYDWLQQHHGFDAEKGYRDIVEAINAIDIWVSEHEAFEYGKVMLGMISGAKEI